MSVEDEEDYKLPPIVIDNGTGFIKAGFSNDKVPRSVFPSLKAANPCVMIGMGQVQWFGHKAMEIKQRGVQFPAPHPKYCRPIEHGIIKHWSEMEELWNYTFYKELKVDPTDAYVLMTDSALNSKSNREKMIKIIFEKFNVSKFAVGRTAVLALFAAGRTTGIVLDSGYNTTSAVPIYEGCILPHAIQQQYYGGYAVSEQLRTMLNDQIIHDMGSTYTGDRQRICIPIKEKYAYIAQDCNLEMVEAQNNEYIKREFCLPDQNKILINDERFKCTELLFTPDRQSPDPNIGIHQILYESIKQCDNELKSQLFGNIVLSGGNTTFHGLDDRLLTELRNLTENKVQNIKIYNNDKKTQYMKFISGYIRDKITGTASTYDVCDAIYQTLGDSSTFCGNQWFAHLKSRTYSSWIGGALLTSLSTFENRWITKEDYEEHGTSIVHKK